MAEVETNVSLGNEAVVDDVQLAVEDYAPGTGTESDAPESTVGSPQVAQPAASPDNGAQQTGEEDFTRRVGHAVSKARNQVRNSPEYQLGQKTISEYAAKNNISREDAYKRIMQEQIDEKATAYKNDPSQFYRDYLTEKQNPKTGQPETNAPQDTADRLGRELAELNASGEVPANFDPSTSIDKEFWDNAQEFGAKAALRIWKASNKPDPVQAEVQRRQAAPRPMSPPTGNNPSGQPVDFTKMSSEEFKKYERAVKSAVASGKRIRFS